MDIQKPRRTAPTQQQTAEHFHNTAELEENFESCVANGMHGFEVVYQPIVGLAAGRWQGLEALCRWKDPKLGYIPPLVFLPIAKRLQLADTVDNWVLQTAACQCRHWSLDQHEDFFLSVNTSFYQVLHADYAGRLLSALKLCQWPVEKLCLDIMHNTPLATDPSPLPALEQLRFQGMRLALEDFGANFFSFSELGQLPFHYLKTHPSLLAGITDDSYKQRLLSIMSELAHAADMQLVVEGIEHGEEFEIVLKNGVDFVQGYFFSRPMAEAKIEQRLYNFSEAGNFRVASGKPGSKGRWLAGKNAFVITPDLFRVLNQCTELLLTKPDFDTVFNEVLSIVGSHFGVGRAYAFLQEEGTVYSNNHEWCARHVASQKQELRHIDMARTTPSILPALRRDNMIITSDIVTLPTDLRDRLRLQDIRAVAILPMWDNDEIIGFIGFDDYRYRRWLEEEIIMLWNLCKIMVDRIRQENLYGEISRRDNILSDLLKSTGLNIYAIDPANHGVLWSNQLYNTTKNTSSLSPLLSGHAPETVPKCYQMLFGRQEPCPECKLPQLLGESDVNQLAWECYTPEQDRYYMIYNSLVPWADGRKVHIEYTLDMTDFKKAQHNLEYFATTDVLTGAANRATLLDTLHAMLRRAHQQNDVLSIAFIDIDQLKFANDTFGHSFGDALITATVNTIRTCTRTEDIIARFGGDEFVVLMPGCPQETAYSRILQARRKLHHLRLEPYNDSFSFSFGIVENREVPYADTEHYMDALLDLADSRMIRYKKAHSSESSVR